MIKKYKTVNIMLNFSLSVICLCDLFPIQSSLRPNKIYLKSKNLTFLMPFSQEELANIHILYLWILWITFISCDTEISLILGPASFVFSHLVINFVSCYFLAFYFYFLQMLSTLKFSRCFCGYRECRTLTDGHNHSPRPVPPSYLPRNSCS